ncbi:MAG: hypothetical protein ACK4WF_05395, partial [Candidatus Brocadiales bacterium]
MLIRRQLIILTVLPVVLSTLAISGALVWTSRGLLLKREFDYQKSQADMLGQDFYKHHFAKVKGVLLHEEHFFRLVPEAGYEVLTLT